LTLFEAAGRDEMAEADQLRDVQIVALWVFGKQFHYDFNVQFQMPRTNSARTSRLHRVGKKSLLAVT
jgi:hypothetical protein